MRSCFSLRRLSWVTDVDPQGGQLSAGCRHDDRRDPVRRRRLPDGTTASISAAADSATIGGTIATNAGGLQVLRHGSTRAQLLGVEAVLGTGETVSHMGGLIKDNTGYDLGGLLCGSEGTLGVVTSARVRLVPPRVRNGSLTLVLPSPPPQLRSTRPRSFAVPARPAVARVLPSSPAWHLVCRSTRHGAAISRSTLGLPLG